MLAVSWRKKRQQDPDPEIVSKVDAKLRILAGGANVRVRKRAIGPSVNSGKSRPAARNRAHDWSQCPLSKREDGSAGAPGGSECLGYGI